MSTDSEARSEYPGLACETIVFRALIYEHWVDKTSGRVMPAAFFRREKRQDEKGLSVGVDVGSVEDYLSQRFRKPTYGVGTLHVGRVRDIGLDVQQDSDDHAVLTGVPRKSADPVMAERFASLLSKQARWVPES